jgi:acyl-CoA thioesterase FadM
VLASAQVDVVCVAVASFRPQRIPASLRTAIESVTDNHNDGAGI